MIDQLHFVPKTRSRTSGRDVGQQQSSLGAEAIHNDARLNNPHISLRQYYFQVRTQRPYTFIKTFLLCIFASGTLSFILTFLMGTVVDGAGFLSPSPTPTLIADVWFYVSSLTIITNNIGMLSMTILPYVYSRTFTNDDDDNGAVETSLFGFWLTPRSLYL